MPRLARIVVPGMPHHVTQRGNRQSDVFFSPRDREFYLYLLDSASKKYGLDIWAYCLMTNHVHLIAIPLTPDALAETLRDAHSAYALQFNKSRSFSGHLWQGRFYSCVLDEPHTLAAVRYVERNPVRAGIAGRAEDYRWSSAGLHCSIRDDRLIAAEFPYAGYISDWSEWLTEEKEESTREIRHRTHTGRPCGSDEFLEKLQYMLGRDVRPHPRGPRPRAVSVNYLGTDY